MKLLHKAGLVWLLLMIVSLVCVAHSKVSADGESDFPEGVMFSIELDKEITDGRVYYQKSSIAPWSYRPLDCIQTECEAFVRTKGNSYVPVGTKFNHYFELEHLDGTTEVTDVQPFIYLDNRFEWLKITEGLINVYYYNEYVEHRAKIVMESVQAAFQVMGNILQIAPTEELNVVVYNNYRHMVRALPRTSQMSNEHLKTEGLAFSENRVLLVLGQGENTAGIASHEFTHLLVYEASVPHYSKVPAWLNEGLAEVGNIDPTDTYGNAFQYAVMTRSVKPLWWLHSFTGTNSGDIMIAYGIGTNVTKFMLYYWGIERMAMLFDNISELGTFDDALLATYGLTEHGLDSVWRQALKIAVLPPPGELDAYLASFEKKDSNVIESLPDLVVLPQSITELKTENSISMDPKKESKVKWWKWPLVAGSIIMGLTLIYFAGIYAKKKSIL